MNVITIPAKPQKGNAAAKEEVKRLRVAAYCRVSTDNEEQASSYESQIQHYTEYINSKPEWVMVRVYADEGISATSTKGRKESINTMDTRGEVLLTIVICSNSNTLTYSFQS